MEVEPLEKPRAVRCPHCDQKRGCKIYGARPDACRNFYCGYRRIKTIDDRWKPSKAKFLINYEEGTHRIVIHVDPVRPDAWRLEPFYSTLKQWSRRAIAEQGMLIVWAGSNATVVFPDRDKNLGHVRDDQYIVRVERMTPVGLQLDFEVADAP
jgi:Fe-S-cluster containining protein